MAVAGMPARRDWEEVNMNTMRKFSAFSMVALLALTLAMAAVSCGEKKEEAPAATETPSTMTDTSMHDTTGAMMADTSSHK